jgi:DNA invertase Pin-like site-specific DNA recombinase
MAKTIQSLSAEQRAKLIKLYEENYISIKELAEKYKLSYYTLRNYMVNQKSLVASKPKLTTEKAYNIKPLVNEEWKKIKLPTNYYYEISNFGRIISYGNNDVPYLINGSSKMGYQTFCYTDNETGKRTSQFVHRLVAMNFVKKNSAKEKVVIHIDGNKANNKAKNLKWATISEAGLHGNNLKSKDENAKERAANITRGKKLTLAKVEMIRKILANPERTTRRKTIAKQFGISEMTLYRIQNGDLWGNKGTGAVVEKSVQKILSDDVVKMIKKMLKEGKHSQAQIAKNIGISETVISRIKQMKTYANV